MQKLYTENDFKEQLNIRGLGHWYVPLITLAGRYDGEFSNWLEDSRDEPISQLTSMVLQLPKNLLNEDERDQLFAKVVITLPFLTWRVKNPLTDERWNPLKSPLSQWMNFQDYPVAWQWETTYPPEDEILEWLLTQSKISFENSGKK